MGELSSTLAKKLLDGFSGKLLCIVVALCLALYAMQVPVLICSIVFFVLLPLFSFLNDIAYDIKKEKAVEERKRKDKELQESIELGLRPLILMQFESLDVSSKKVLLLLAQEPYVEGTPHKLISINSNYGFALENVAQKLTFRTSNPDCDVAPITCFLNNHAYIVNCDDYLMQLVLSKKEEINNEYSEYCKKNNISPYD